MSWFENFRKKRGDKKKDLDDRIADIVAASDRKAILKEGLRKVGSYIRRIG
jgi:hypothetical protein